jgi:TPR repeat protein
MLVYRCVKGLSIALMVLFMADSTPAQMKGLDPAVLAKATAGDPASQYQVGWHYEHPDAIWGEGYTESGSSPHDYAQAAFWYLKAAEQGYAAAQYDLGDSYLFGHGLPVDYEQGITWFRKAAEQGYPAAQTDLARFYLNGKFVSQDYAQAVYWYRKAAERGNPDGQAVLSSLYQAGQGVPQDYSEAYFWMSLAAANRELTGTYSFLAKEHADERDRIAAHLTKAELLKVQERTRKWVADQATQQSRNDFEAMKQELRQSQSFIHLKERADAGSAMEQYEVGFCYEEGDEVPQDYVQAARWYQKSADQGFAAAQYSLGMLYEKNLGVQQNYERAYFWLNLAASAYTEGDDGLRYQVVSHRESAAKHITSARLLELQKQTTEYLITHPKPH